MKSDPINNAESSFKITQIEEQFLIFTIENKTTEPQMIRREIGHDFIQFHFCIKGSGRFHFHAGNYILALEEEKSLLLYNPDRELPLNVEIAPNSWLVSVLISIKNFHALFSEEAGYIDFLKKDKRDKKYYAEAKISPAMAVVLSQIMNFNLNPSVKKLYLKAKAYELVGLYFNRPETANFEQCPFLTDENNVRKIRKAKDILIQRMVEPPTLQQLSEEIGLSLKKLKEGFKEIYGDTVFGFLLDYKLEYARKLLETGEYNVNEIGLKVGYSTASHFIAAFKKKFGTTPKKYLQSSNLVSQ